MPAPRARDPPVEQLTHQTGARKPMGKIGPLIAVMLAPVGVVGAIARLREGGLTPEPTPHLEPCPRCRGNDVVLGVRVLCDPEHATNLAPRCAARDGPTDCLAGGLVQGHRRATALSQGRKRITLPMTSFA